MGPSRDTGRGDCDVCCPDVPHSTAGNGALRHGDDRCIDGFEELDVTGDRKGRGPHH